MATLSEIEVEDGESHKGGLFRMFHASIEIRLRDKISSLNAKSQKLQMWKVDPNNEAAVYFLRFKNETSAIKLNGYNISKKIQILKSFAGITSRVVLHCCLHVHVMLLLKFD